MTDQKCKCDFDKWEPEPNGNGHTRVCPLFARRPQPTTDEWDEIEKLATCYSHGYMCEDCKQDFEKLKKHITSHYIKKSTLFETGKRMKEEAAEWQTNEGQFRRETIDDLLSNFK